VPESAAAKPWGLAKRLLFRFALVYFVLYALPFPFRDLWTTFDGTLTELKEELVEWDVDVDGEGWAWRKDVTLFFDGDEEAWKRNEHSVGWFERWWEATTTWVSRFDWVHLEVIHQRTGSGDTAHAWLQLAVSVVLALLLTALWSLIDRRRTRHAALVPWLHVAVRWYLGFAMLSYGMHKLYAGQFVYPSLQRLMTPLGDSSPMALVWNFMGFSKPYEVFTGVAEVAGGLLLLWRRTSLLGSLVVIGVMTNVTMLNWLYDVPVKLYSAHLLLFAIALATPDARRLWCMFVANKPAPPADLRLTRFAWLNGLLVAFGIVWLGFHLIVSHHEHVEYVEKRAEWVQRPPLYGVWQVEKLVRGGEDVPATDVTRWEFLAFDVRDSGWVRTVGGQMQWLHQWAESEPDGGQEGTMKIAPMRGRSKPDDAPTWTYERGEKTVQARKPKPRSFAEYGEMVDQVRPTLVLRGPWDGVDLEVHLVRKVFELERGFHFVQEVPVNR